MNTQPRDGLLRLWQIIGPQKSADDLPPIIPMAKSSWYHFQRKGMVPPPVHIGSTPYWRAEDIWRLVDTGDWREQEGAACGVKAHLLVDCLALALKLLLMFV